MWDGIQGNACVNRAVRASAALFAGLSLMACGGGPQVKVTAQYRPQMLQHARVLVVPLAVSDELGDARTGIVLSDQARASASAEACKMLTDEVSERTIVCADQDAVGRSPALAELERLFALDQPIPPSLWQSIRDSSGAKHVLLFRPESVSSSQEVSRQLETAPGNVVTGTDTQPHVTSVLVSLIIAKSNIPHKTVSTTDLEYTLSASLVDLQSGAVLKVGVHSGGDSRKVGRNLGFAEPPPVVPILEKIMVALGEKVLDD
jgi:hypothetical protein